MGWLSFIPLRDTNRQQPVFAQAGSAAQLYRSGCRNCCGGARAYRTFTGAAGASGLLRDAAHCMLALRWGDGDRHWSGTAGLRICGFWERFCGTKQRFNGGCWTPGSRLARRLRRRWDLISAMYESSSAMLRYTGSG
jgi:hypothetical protein